MQYLNQSEIKLLYQLACKKQNMYCSAWFRILQMEIQCLVCNKKFNNHIQILLNHAREHLNNSNLIPFI